MKYQTTYVYSPEANSFYEVAMLHLYEAAGALPDSLIEVEDGMFEEFTQSVPPFGKTRVPGPDGMPVWVDSPPPSDEEIQARNEARRAQLMKEAGERIAPLQDASDLGIATEVELDSLRAWKTYRVLLNRVDGQPGFPMDINWPTRPE